MNAITLDAVRRKLAGRFPVRVVDPSAGQAAVAIVLVGEPSGPEALFIERARREGDPWSGQVAFPGGRHDGSDPSLLVTAIRETREEVGVDLSHAELLGELDDVHPRTRTLPALVVRPFVFGLSRRPEVRYSVEVASHRWVRLDDLLAAGVHGDVEIQPLGRTFPAYRVGGYVIWGLTERIITPFLHLATSEHSRG